MTQYWAVTSLMLGLFLILFLLVEALGVPLLTDPSPWLEHGGTAAALVGVGLLVAGLFWLIGRWVRPHLPDRANHRGASTLAYPAERANE